MRRTPTIAIGLAMRRAPLLGCKFGYEEGGQFIEGVRSNDPKVASFVNRQIARVWQHGVRHLLRAQVYGWAGAEIRYFLNPETNMVEVDRLLPRRSEDVQALLRGGELIGMRVRNVKHDGNEGDADIMFPRCVYHVHAPQPGQFYGESILHGAYEPWCDKSLDGGANDVRKLFMRKDSYGGSTVRYPLGTIYVDGKEIPARDIAQQIVEQIQAGSVKTIPSETDDAGNSRWDIEEATIPSNPQHILQFPKDLDVEMLRGMEIPEDVLTTDSSGAWAGKRVPMAAFYSGLDMWLGQLVNDICEQVIEYLVSINFGSAIPFEATTKPLAEQAMEQQTGATEQPEQPQRMSVEEAVGRGVIQAEDIVRSARMANLAEDDPVLITDGGGDDA